MTRIDLKSIRDLSRPLAPWPWS